MPSVINTLLGTKKTKKANKSKKAKAKPRKTKVKARRTASSTASGSMANDRVDVRSPADIKKLESLLKKNKVVMVLVYADWCGHCQTFKKDIWSKLSAMPNRKVPMAQVKAEELDKTPLKSANVDGYPTVMMVGNDMKSENINDARNLPMMKKILSADPEKVLAAANTPAPTPKASLTIDSASASGSLNEGDPLVVEESATPTAQAETIRRSTAEKRATMSVSAAASLPTPPNVEEDLIASQMPATATRSLLNSGRTNTAATTAPGPGIGAMRGGSLYAALAEAAQGLLPAALLTGAAITLDKRQRRIQTAKRRARRRRLTAKLIAARPGAR